MHESFLHYVWQMQYFRKDYLSTTSGEAIEILWPGQINSDAGPDFSGARIKIGTMNWVGSVEIHTTSSAWIEHQHTNDSAYDNVILHVVWKHDLEIQRRDSTLIPTLELRNRVNETLIRTYRQLITSSLAIPCQDSFPRVKEIKKFSMLDRALLQRLERKAVEVVALYEQNGSNWEETLYQLLARNFGFKVNADPFMQLARLLPLKIIQKQAGSLEQVESLLFGQAGFLDSKIRDPYFGLLQREHRILSQKYELKDRRMSPAQWKFLRLRPANFPTLRLAQLSAILYHRKNLFSEIVESGPGHSLQQIFEAVPSTYWQTHYRFARRSTANLHRLGIDGINNILINTVVPVWVGYGKQSDQPMLVDRAVDLLQQLPAEENKITRLWSNLGWQVRSAFDSQALLELHSHFCLPRKCLNCVIGTHLMNPTA